MGEVDAGAPYPGVALGALGGQPCVSPAPHVKVVVVPPIDIDRLRGDATPQQLQDFLASLQRAWNCEPGISAARRTDILLANIDEEVRRCLRRWGRNLGQDADLLVSRLKEIYGDKSSQQVLLLKFLSIRQGKSESVDAYANRLQDAFFTLIDRQEVMRKPLTDESILSETFVNGLKDMNLQRKLDDRLQENTCQFYELFDIAKRWFRYEPSLACKSKMGHFENLVSKLESGNAQPRQ